MILIFSTSGDPSTLDVMRWIDHLGDARVVRVNADVTYHVELTYEDDDFHVQIDDDDFRLADVSSAWLRKGDFWFRGLFGAVAANDRPTLGSYLTLKLQHESRALRDHFHHVLRRRAAVLGSANGSVPNKLIVLDHARRLGLRTPPFTISTRRAHAEGLVASGAGHVTKALSDGVHLFDPQHSKAGYFTYTEALDATLLAGRDAHLAPSFFQRYVDKAVELRVFFIDDSFHTVAIVSQNDAQTAVDYRHYNNENPNRVVPYRLPRDVEDKLAQLARELGLNTGSIDMIVDRSGDFYFLEVNPVGQFAGNSEACNLGIERRIAQRLLAHE